jgi:outer membrane protein assembly factor BamB
MLAGHDADKDGKIQLSEVKTEDVNGRIMYRLFKSIDKVSGDNDGVLTRGEFEDAFPAERKDGGLVRIRLGGKGDVAKTHVDWRQAKGIPYLTSPLLYRGVLYSVRDGGILTAYEAETGKVLKEARLDGALGDYYASPVAGDGKLYFVSREGKLRVVRAGPQWELAASGDLDEAVIATPAISGGRIFIRTEKSLYSFVSGDEGSRDPSGGPAGRPVVPGS